MKKKVLVPFADGMEEMEAVVITDVLRRADIEVQTVSLTNEKIATGSRNTKHIADVTLESIDPAKFDMIILPGGKKGTENLGKNQTILQILKEFSQQKKFIGAICAAPSILIRENILHPGDLFTGFPGSVPDIEGNTNQPVAITNRIITGIGPGYSFEFALEVVKLLCGEEKYQETKKGLLL